MSSPVFEEAARLAAALQEWAVTRGPGAVGAAAEALGSHVGGSSECTVCPVCQALALVRGAQPEVFEHLSAAASSLTAAFTALVESAAAGSPSARPPVEHIEVG